MYGFSRIFQISQTCYHCKAATGLLEKENFISSSYGDSFLDVFYVCGLQSYDVSSFYRKA